MSVPVPIDVWRRRLLSRLAGGAMDFISQGRSATIGATLLCLIAGAALLAPWIAPQNPYDLTALDVMEGGLPPLSESSVIGTYWLGTDAQGRDMLSAILYGLRTSLAVAGLATVIAVAIGLGLGLPAAYFGRWFDAAVMRLVDLQLSFPAILVALVLLAILGRGVDKVILALVLVQWAYYTRTIRASALSEIQKDYISAAHGLGLGRPRIIFRHLLPNSLPSLIVVATVQMAHAVSLEATLSFLGVGVPITEPSLGLLISNGYIYLLSGKYWISIVPGIALFIAIICINIVGDRIRDLINPRLRS